MKNILLFIFVCVSAIAQNSRLTPHYPDAATLVKVTAPPVHEFVFLTNGLGPFRYDSSSTDATNTSTVFKPNNIAGAGRWLWVSPGSVTPTPAGSNKQIQFNNNGALGASVDLQFDSATKTLSVTNINSSGDTDTGIHFAGLDTLRYDLGGSTRFRMTTGAIVPGTGNQYDLGTSGLGFRTGYYETAVWSKGIASGTTTKMGNYTTTALDKTILADASGGAITITLLAPASATSSSRALEFVVVKVDSTTNAVTVQSASGTINGGTRTLSIQWHTETYKSDGSNYYVESEGIRPRGFVTDYGAIASDGNSDDAAFSRATNFLSHIIVPAGTFRFNTNFTLPLGVTLELQRGAILQPGSSTIGLILHGEIQAGPSYHFDISLCGSSTTNILFPALAVGSPITRTKEVWANWWNVSIDNSGDDDGQKLEAFFDSVPAGLETPRRMLPGSYRSARAIDVPTGAQVYAYGVEILYSGTSSSVGLITFPEDSSGQHVRGMAVGSAKTTAGNSVFDLYGFRVRPGCNRFILEDTTAAFFNGAGYYIEAGSNTDAVQSGKIIRGFAFQNRNATNYGGSALHPAFALLITNSVIDLEVNIDANQNDQNVLAINNEGMGALKFIGGTWQNAGQASLNITNAMAFENITSWIYFDGVYHEANGCVNNVYVKDSKLFEVVAGQTANDFSSTLYATNSFHLNNVLSTRISNHYFDHAATYFVVSTNSSKTFIEGGSFTTTGATELTDGQVVAKMNGDINITGRYIGTAGQVKEIDSGGMVEKWVATSGSGNVARVTSPTFVTPALGAATAATPAADDNDTSVATTAYVQTELSDYAPKVDAIFSGSLQIPNGASPTTDAFGEIAGDNNAWASGRGALQIYDGTANTYAVGVLASDTPSNGQVPKWNTGGTITWEDDGGGGGGVAGTMINTSGTGSTGAVPYQSDATLTNYVTKTNFNFFAATNQVAVYDSTTTANTLPASGLLLNNPATASNGNQNHSPVIRRRAQAWKSNATAASQEVGFDDFVLAVQGTSAASATWYLVPWVNGATNANVMTYSSAGVLTTVGAVNAGGELSTGNGNINAQNLGSIRWGSRSRIQSSADGVFELFNNAVNNFTRLNLGGTSSSFPAVARDGATVEIQKADGADGTIASAGARFGIVTKTGNYTTTDTDHTILADASGGAITITLLAPASAFSSPNGGVFIVKKIDATANNVTVQVSGGANMDSFVSIAISTQWAGRQFQSNGTQYYITGSF